MDDFKFLEDLESKSHVTIHWLRHGLRLHDNPALLAGLENCREFYPIFIFDGIVAGKAFQQLLFQEQFLLETLEDLDEHLKAFGSRLHVFHGNPVDVFTRLIEEWGVTRITFEEDPEPIWQKRDNEVKGLCFRQDVECIERVSHTLWDPRQIIKENGGTPPLTYAMFCQVMQIVGQPPKPVQDPDFRNISLLVSDSHEEKYGLPSLEFLGIKAESEHQASPYCRYLGGETKALKLLSAHLEKEYTVHPNVEIPSSITSQLIWREYFYCMSVNNQAYNRMKDNSICLNIDWYDGESKFQQWKMGRTGYPWIDACMRQLLQEGWIHQVCRHATACFLTRGDLWIDWQKGLQVFDRYLLDADWSVCAGNRMWVSSSSFESVLQCPCCICPIRYGRRMDPTGDYVRRYVPELKDIPLQFLFEPWNAPHEVQKEANCVIGQNYPSPMVDHKIASQECRIRMETIKQRSKDTPHIGPASEAEALSFMWTSKRRGDKLEVCNHNMDTGL